MLTELEKSIQWFREEYLDTPAGQVGACGVGLCQPARDFFCRLRHSFPIAVFQQTPDHTPVIRQTSGQALIEVVPFVAFLAARIRQVPTQPTAKTRAPGWHMQLTTAAATART